MAVVRVRIPVARPLRRVGLPRSELPGLGDPRGGPSHAGGGAADHRDHVPASWYRLAPDDGVVPRVRTSVPGCRLRRRTAGVPVAPARATAPIGAGPRIPAPAELKEPPPIGAPSPSRSPGVGPARRRRRALAAPLMPTTTTQPVGVWARRRPAVPVGGGSKSDTLAPRIDPLDSGDPLGRDAGHLGRAPPD